MKNCLFIGFMTFILFLNFCSLNNGTDHENSIKSSCNINQRVKTRSFPSVFQAWGDATNMAPEDIKVTRARHDLAWWGIGDVDGLVWDTGPVGGYRVLATCFTDASIVKGQNFRQTMLGYNPNMILLANLNYQGAKASWLPDNHEWWLRDANGNKIVSWTGAETWYRLDFANPGLRTQVVAWAVSAINSGVYDGVMLDWWDENQEASARLSLLQEVRSAIGDTFLIIVNANDRYSTQSAPYINGVFMETGANIPTTATRWNKIKDVMVWNQANVLEPKLVGLEVWYVSSSDDWYPFWDKSLGKAVGAGSLQPNGSYKREFENGYAVYNPKGNGQVTVTFPVNYIRVSTGASAKVHNVADQDGDIFLINQTR